MCVIGTTRICRKSVGRTLRPGHSIGRILHWLCNLLIPSQLWMQLLIKAMRRYIASCKKISVISRRYVNTWTRANMFYLTTVYCKFIFNCSFSCPRLIRLSPSKIEFVIKSVLNVSTKSVSAWIKVFKIYTVAIDLCLSFFRRPSILRISYTLKKFLC